VRKPAIVAAVAAAALLGMSAQSASAEVVCKSVGKFPQQHAVCADVALNESGTTVAPSAWVGCSLFSGQAMCAIDRVSVGQTGVTTNPAYGLPYYEIESASIRHDGGVVGTVHVNGTDFDIVTTNWCAGTPEFCAAGG
jgi:hypothetical protein